MSFVIGGVAALVALIAGIIGQVDPFASLGRAGIAFVVGVFASQLWSAITQTMRLTPMAELGDGEPAEAVAAMKE